MRRCNESRWARENLGSSDGSVVHGRVANTPEVASQALRVSQRFVDQEGDSLGNFVVDPWGRERHKLF